MNFTLPKGRLLIVAILVSTVLAAAAIAIAFNFTRPKSNDEIPKPIDTSKITGDSLVGHDRYADNSSAISLSYIFTNIPDRRAELYVALNSLLAQRSCAINFHFAVDDVSKNVVEEFFRVNTQLKNVSVSYHTFDVVIEKLKDLKTTFHRTALYKSSPELLFSADINETVILDFDFIHMSDFCPVYRKYIQKLKAHSPTAVMAIGPETCTTYTNDPRAHILSSANRWIPEWNGVNAGLYFVLLDRMREMKWTDFFKAEISPLLVNDPEHKFLQFPEQNIFNYVSLMHPEMVLELPPGLNLQIGPYKDDIIFNLYNNGKREIDIIHGNMRAFGWDRSIARYIWWLYLPSTFDTYGANVKPKIIQSLEDKTVDEYAVRKSLGLADANVPVLQQLRSNPLFLLNRQTMKRIERINASV